MFSRKFQFLRDLALTRGGPKTPYRIYTNPYSMSGQLGTIDHPVYNDPLHSAPLDYEKGGLDLSPMLSNNMMPCRRGLLGKCIRSPYGIDSPYRQIEYSKGPLIPGTYGPGGKETGIIRSPFIIGAPRFPYRSLYTPAWLSSRADPVSIQLKSSDFTFNISVPINKVNAVLNDLNEEAVTRNGSLKWKRFTVTAPNLKGGQFTGVLFISYNALITALKEILKKYSKAKLENKDGNTMWLPELEKELEKHDDYVTGYIRPQARILLIPKY